jgi:predicted ribosomally synthesized peptide with SipW-like signal peptide
MQKKILVSMMVIGLVAALAGAGLYAYFSDTETSSGNTFTAGTLDLELSAAQGSVVVLNVGPLAPGDSGSNTWIAKNVGSIAGKLSLTVSAITNNDNGLTEPESEVDTTGGAGEGELGQYLNVVLWVDLDSDGVKDVGEVLYSGTLNGMAGTYSNVAILPKEWSAPIILEWSIDSGVGNVIQSDSASFDITFSLEQTRATIVESHVLNLGPTGWGGWSDKEASTHGWVFNCIVKNVGTGQGNYAQLIRWVPGASVTVGGTTYTYPVTPFGYTYADGETGYIIQNDNDAGESLQLILVYP